MLLWLVPMTVKLVCDTLPSTSQVASDLMFLLKLLKIGLLLITKILMSLILTMFLPKRKTDVLKKSSMNKNKLLIS